MTAGSESRGLRGYDLVSAVLFLAFAAFSVIWPATGFFDVDGVTVPRGYLIAPLLAALGVIVMRVGHEGPTEGVAGFVRTFYPQLVFGFLFMEAIRLSGQACGGRTYDAFFAGLDAAVFHLQPAREFSARLAPFPAWTEVMFAAYFSFYVIFAVTPWITWFRGDRREAERDMTVLSLYMLVVYVFYVFFRVEGPKYWLPDLRKAWYDGFRGGLFVAFFRLMFSHTNLSGAAFPSSHVAVSIMMAVFAARSDRRTIPLYGTLCLLIALATVFIHAHWAADVAGGIIATAVLVPVFGLLDAPLARLCRALEGHRRRAEGTAVPQSRTDAAHIVNKES